MPWEVLSGMRLRKDFVDWVVEGKFPMSQVCRDCGISRKTGYKWVERYRRLGVPGLEESSRRPLHSPERTSTGIEDLILSVRVANPCWGGRKIRARLEHLGHTELPSVSTITEILRRHGKIAAEESPKHRPFQRFERAEPNALWQMDFKGYVAYADTEAIVHRCHPLTILDDHSRYSLCLSACPNERHATVQDRLIATFRTYGLPVQMTMDNGAPWGNSEEHRQTALTVWLMRLGIRVSHSRPYHPQTQGKDERFHRTLKAELLSSFEGHSLEAYQQAFDPWRERYNQERPHEALGNQVPANRYHVSDRVYPEQLPAIEYGSGDLIRKVQQDGTISFRGHTLTIGGAFRGHPIAVRPAETDGVLDVYFCHHWIKQIDLHELKKV